MDSPTTPRPPTILNIDIDRSPYRIVPLVLGVFEVQSHMCQPRSLPSFVTLIATAKTGKVHFPKFFDCLRAAE